MTKKQRYQFVIAYFEKQLPEPETELQYTNPFQLLVAVILSAQCTDKRINKITPILFRDFPDAAALSLSNQEALFPYLKSVSYPNNKTKHLLGMSKILVKDFNGQVPLQIVQLMRLPGVGRKTANVITSVLDHQPNMAVDTHVFRVAARIGLTTNAKNPLQAEQQLIKGFPKEIIPKAHHWLILHGRYICLARKPKCAICGLNKVCKYYRTTILKSKKERSEKSPLSKNL